jgi:hypothetical protein
MIKWKEVELKGNEDHGLYIQGTFDDTENQRMVIFSVSLWGNQHDVPFQIYELVDSDMGKRIVATVEMKNDYWKVIQKCQRKINDGLDDMLSKYWEQ